MLRVESLELDPGILGSELPIHADLRGIAPLGPGGCLAAKSFQLGDAAIQARSDARCTFYSWGDLLINYPKSYHHGDEFARSGETGCWDV